MQIHNTMTRRKAPFEPIVPGQVRMYVCGITVYDYCHLGHGRVMVAFDVITRYLRQQGYDVRLVRNITDVDDKIIARAHNNNEPISSLTARMIDAMHEDEHSLGIRPPDEEPRATAYIGEILAMVERLVEQGHAYPAANGDVYYRVRSFADYGKLSNRKPDDMRAGARIEVDEAKEDPLDFVLWKAAKPGEQSWPSPWGPGRPGWHIECSAMSKCCLGDNFDIHGGGPDLIFPHHENEIAQSEAANEEPFANVWMHVGALRLGSEKMSKSLGNFFYLRDILKDNDPEVVRYYLLSSHYRSPLQYVDDSLEEARRSLIRFYTALDGVVASEGDVSGEYAERFFDAMDDDFNTPVALAALFDLARELNRAKSDQPELAPALAYELRRLAGILGLLQRDSNDFLQARGESNLPLPADEIEARIAARAEAKRSKDFAQADAIRAELESLGIVLKDSREGTSWVFDKR
ncbi:cysteine--tRNA ligase [Cernens ardua]|uniref:cysteine--tRNA ligase n=1 Tax=Cernens ardua TaxID=3402176 RepID=UPI003F96BCAD